MNITIIGLGLLGGSFGLAIRQAQAANRVIGIDLNQEIIDRACERGAIDEGHLDSVEAVREADLVVLAMPVRTIIDTVSALADCLSEKTILFDLGSTKAAISRKIAALPIAVRYIGGHPMAGSEKFGLDFARADLYTEKIVFLTPTPDDELEAINLVIEFWREIGSIPIELNAARHDQVVAYASHMPHLMSALIAKATLGHDEADAHGMACASGFRDITRVASGNVDMWREITMQNSVAILAALDDCQTELANLRQSITDGDEGQIVEFLEIAKRCRDDWLENSARGRQGNDNT
mgnify:CR=1 FL=1